MTERTPELESDPPAEGTPTQEPQEQPPIDSAVHRSVPLQREIEKLKLSDESQSAPSSNQSSIAMSATGHSSTASGASRPASKPGATGTKPAPAGPKAAMNMFKQMDAKLPPPKFAQQSAPAAGAVNSRNPATIKQMMLKWCQHQVLDYPTVKIENFSSSWADGLAFCALAHHFYSDEFDFAKLDSKNRRHNLTLAFETLKKRADLEPLLEVNDMLAMKDNPDWKCVFTYVQSIYRRFARQSAAPSTGLSDSAANAVAAAAAPAGPEPDHANPFRHSVAEDHA